MTNLIKAIVGIFCIFYFLSIKVYSMGGLNSPMVDQSMGDTLAVTISQNSKYLLAGQEIVITVSVCNGNSMPKLSVGGAVIPFNSKGLAILTQPGGSVGVHKIPLKVTSTDAAGETQAKEYIIEYEVGQAWTVIDEGNLNLLYIGVDNPLYISAFGVPEQKVKVEISGTGSTISKSAEGTYTARVTTKSDQCFVSVYADSRILAQKEFRVVQPPNPNVTIGSSLSGSQVELGNLIKAGGIDLANSQFPFKVSYSVTSFNIKVVTSAGISKIFKSNSSKFSPEVKQYLAQVPTGSMIIIDDIIVQEKSIGIIKLFPSVFYTK